MTQTSTINNLYRKYGVTKATPSNGGEPRKSGDIHELVFKITLANLTQSETILNDVMIIPDNVRIKDIEIFTETAAATGTAIDLGIIARDRSTEVDYNGLLAAFPTASMNAAGEQTTISDNTTYDGALVGTTISTGGYISCSMTDATSFTAGLIKVAIRYYTP